MADALSRATHKCWKMNADTEITSRKKVERWIFIWFDRGKKDIKRIVSPRHHLNNIIQLLNMFSNVTKHSCLTWSLRLVGWKSHVKLNTINQSSMALIYVFQWILRCDQFDVNGVSFVMGNRATAHMCNDKHIFKRMTFHDENKWRSVSIVGPRGQLKAHETCAYLGMTMKRWSTLMLFPNCAVCLTLHSIYSAWLNMRKLWTPMITKS